MSDPQPCQGISYAEDILSSSAVPLAGPYTPESRGKQCLETQLLVVP